MVARINTVAFHGVDVQNVDVQVQISNGLPAFTIAGPINLRQSWKGLHMKLFLLGLIGVLALLPISTYASTLTSIKVDDRSYNLLVFDDKEHEEIIETFNKALQREARPEVIDRCSFTIDLPVGVAKGNHSYGGFCSYMKDKETKNVMICADMMVGHLKIQTTENYKYPEDGINELAKFVADNCYGG